MGTGNKGKRRGIRAVKGKGASPKKSLQNMQPPVDNDRGGNGHSDADIGQLRVGVHETSVVFEFGGSIARMPPDAARRFGAALFDAAKQAEGKALLVNSSGKPIV